MIKLIAIDLFNIEKIIFSNSGIKKYGIHEIIEKIDNENRTLEIWYSNGDGVARVSAECFGDFLSCFIYD